MSKPLVRIGFLLVGIALSLVFLYLAFQGFDLRQVWDAMLRVRFEFFIPMVVPYVLTFLTKVWRWRVMFHPDERRARFGLLFTSLMISYIPLPFRMGEVARGVVASTRSGISMPRVFSTIVVEKVLDVLTLLLFLAVTLPFVELPAGLKGSAIVLAVLVLAALALMVILVMKPALAKRLVHAIASRLPARFGARVEAAAEQVLLGLAPLSEGSIAARLAMWSVATWGINSVTVYLMLLAFNVQVTPMAAVVLVVITNLSMAIPSAPGYVGPYEAAVVGVLDILGVARAQAQAFAIIYHFVGLVPVALLGVIAAVQQGVGIAVFRSQPAPTAADSTLAPGGDNAATLQTHTQPLSPAGKVHAARDEQC